MIQVQTGLLVTERKWCDLISYSGGLPMSTARVFPSPQIQDAIINAAKAFEQRLIGSRALYETALATEARLIPTVRKIYEEMV
jgi:hypothetical protein